MYSLLLLAADAEATITVTARGTLADNAASSASMTLTPSSSIPAGSSAVLCVAVDNNVASGGINFPNPQDSGGNRWIRLRDVSSNTAAGGGAEAVFYWAYLPNGLSTSQNVTISFSTANVTAKTAALWELAPSSGNVVMPQNNGGASTLMVSSTSPSLLVPNTTAVGQVTVGMVAYGNSETWTDDTDTVGGVAWSASQTATVGSGATGMSIITQYKLPTSAQQQTYNPIAGTAATGVVMVQTFLEADAKIRVVGANSTSASSENFTPRRPFSVGSLAVACVAADNANAGTSNIGTVSDSNSNVWTRQQTRIFNPAGANSGVEVAIYTAPITTAITDNQTDQITITYGGTNVGAKAYMVYEFAPKVAGNMSVVSGAIDAGSATQTPSTTTTSIASGDIVVAMGGSETTDVWTGDSSSTNGAWSFATHIGFANTTAGIALISQYKVTTAAGTQTYAPTEGSSPTNDTIMGWISLHDSSPTLSPTAFFQFFP